MPHMNRKTTSEKWKFNPSKKLGLEWAVNGLGKPFRKKFDPKNRKNSKKQSVKLPHVNKKPLPRNRIFVQTPFLHSTLKLEQKKSRRKTTRLFAPFPVSALSKSLFQFDFKNHENVWTDLKKNSRTSPDVRFKEFLLTQQKTRPRTDYDWIGKTT